MVDAKEESDEGRKCEKEDLRGLWARYDSRPLLKANEPRGRAESERRRRKCVEGGREAESSEQMDGECSVVQTYSLVLRLREKVEHVASVLSRPLTVFPIPKSHFQ